MTTVTFGTRHLDENNMEIYNKIVSDNLAEFNRRTGDNIQLVYKPNKSSYFERLDKNTPPFFGNYFDDYCLLTINWMLSLYGAPHLDKWVDDKIYANRILDTFQNRKDTSNEQAMFYKLFKDYAPITPYFTPEQTDILKRQINEIVSVVMKS